MACDLLNQVQNEKITARGARRQKRQFGLQEMIEKTKNH